MASEVNNKDLFMGIPSNNGLLLLLLITYNDSVILNWINHVVVLMLILISLLFNHTVIYLFIYLIDLAIY